MLLLSAPRAEPELEQVKLVVELGPVWQGSGSFKNGSSSGSSSGAAFLMELKPFW